MLVFIYRCIFTFWVIQIVASSASAQSISHDLHPLKIDLFENGSIITSESDSIPFQLGTNTVMLRLKNVKFENVLDVVSDKGLTLMSVEYVTEFESVENRDILVKWSQEQKIILDSIKSTTWELEKLDYLMQILDVNKNITVSDKSIYTEDLDELLAYYKEKITGFHTQRLLLSDKLIQLNKQLSFLQSQQMGLRDSVVENSGLLKIIFKAQASGLTKFLVSVKSEKLNWKPSYTATINRIESNAILSIWAQINGLESSKRTVKYRFITGPLPNETGDSERMQRFMYESKSNHSGNEKLLLDTKKFKAEIINSYSQKTEPQVISSAHIYGMYGLGFDGIHITVIDDGRFTGNMTVSKDAYTDTMHIPLGALPNISVSRQITSDKSRKSLIGNNVKHTIEYSLSINNTSNKEVKIVIEQKLPIKNHSGSEVEYSLPRTAEIHSNGRSFTYTIDMTPQSTQVISYGFTLSFPQNSSIDNYLYTR